MAKLHETDTLYWDVEALRREGTSEDKFAQYNKYLKRAKRLVKKMKRPRFKKIIKIKKLGNTYRGSVDFKDVANNFRLFGSGHYVFDDKKHMMQRIKEQTGKGRKYHLQHYKSILSYRKASRSKR